MFLARPAVARPACLVVALVGQALLPSASVATTPPVASAPIPRSVWLYEPDPAALPAVNSRLDEVLDLVNPVNGLRMADTEIRIHVIPEDWRLTDLPPWSNLRGARLPDPNPFDGYTETRTYDTLRGLGPPSCIDGPLEIALGEELLVPSPQGGSDVGKILVHEVGHGIECSLTPTQSQMLDSAYDAAGARFPTGMVGDNPTYSASTRREYFAEGVTSWFEAARGPTYRRAWLRENDRALYDLMAEVFAVPPPPPRCDTRRATLVMRPGAGPLTGTPGNDVIMGTPGDDVINGGGGDDLICGEDGNDAIRGGYGADRLYGGPGDDTLDGGAADDVLSGDAGEDSLTDMSGGNRLLGGAGRDRCEAEATAEITSCNEPEPPPPTTTTTRPPETSTEMAT
ncbi:MAG TPA: hypothetical protein VK611_27350 [Acidimicrobiales bacterium]|nr:hypothetical protein [Acidimicrobiales bacterium]